MHTHKLKLSSVNFMGNTKQGCNLSCKGGQMSQFLPPCLMLVVYTLQSRSKLNYKFYAFIYDWYIFSKIIKKVFRTFFVHKTLTVL